MPGARSRVNPLGTGELCSASDEISQLEQHLQRQLEDDVARIFDESIYSDLEVVSGKLKILTHSCILKARTHKFYHKLQAILHIDIGRNAFDEVYSFISDAYTECDIQHQEKEIIKYLNENVHVNKSGAYSKNNLIHFDESELSHNSSSFTVVTKIKTKEFDESDVFSTPSCVSPEESNLQKTLSSSPSTELTKEYYALVPIEGNVLDKELIEQDALSSAFKSFIKSQGDINGKQTKQCVKPTSLFLTSHLSKINKHSTNCDIEKEIECNTITNVSNKTKININNTTSQVRKPNQFAEAERYYNNSSIERTQETAYSPDSLVTDEPSSSSDYLSAAYTVSPGAASSGCFSQLNMSENKTKMDNNITASDSGLETTGLMESINSHKDITLTDLSLTESTFHDILSDETNNSFDASSPSELKQLQKLKICSPQVSHSGATASQTDLRERQFNNPMSVTDTCGTSSKEEKQRQNEEIVILESSSLSSETGSWESVFPPKASVNDLCQKFINHERQNSSAIDFKSSCSSVIDKNQTPINPIGELCPSLVQKSPFKSSSCFIDAASLADEGDFITVKADSNEVGINCSGTHNILKDDSPNDCSEENENEDSLEQADKDVDLIEKDDSPVIFEMTPITEDSLNTNAYENAPVMSDLHLISLENCSINLNKSDLVEVNEKATNSTKLIFQPNTPNNSIISVGPQEFHNSKKSDIDINTLKSENERVKKPYIEPIEKVNEDYYKFRKHSNESPIISGGASIEDHLPQVGSYSGSPMSKRKIENIPIVSGAYVPDEEKMEKQAKPVTNAHAWVVDMSQSNEENNQVKTNPNGNLKPVMNPCLSSKDTLKSSNSETSKSRSSVDSDSSEKSTHKFYIDLSTLPDATPPDQNLEEDNNEKKNIFSMFIDLGDNSTVVKEMPARLSSSLTKKSIKTENKTTNKNAKTIKNPSSANKIVIDTSNIEVQSTFEKLESLCNDPNISISDIIKKPDHKSVDLNCKPDKHVEVNNLQNSQKKIATMVTEEESVQTNTGDLFVKLSDLDKPVLKTDKEIVPEIEKLYIRMTRSIPENNWPESSHASNSRSVDIISSFHSENALSLNRLFPHLKNDFSKSMPGSLSSRTRSPFRLGVSSSPGDIDEQPSDASEISSVQSSMCRSVVENSTTEETSQTSSLFRNCQSRLGQDLLRMFIEEIAPDVIVEVQGRRIKAHKCILSSRCQYFAGILSGGWVESAGDVIPLPPFSFGVVHFALCHIYSGVSNIPDSISIVELATIADMLSLEGLKEAIMFTLKAKYCHHFHKPCPVCTAGVLECFPLSSVYGLDDLYRKCLRWITKYFHKVWPTKAFATLPSELLDKCYQEHIINLTTENFVETVYGCGITMSALSTSRWAEVVGRMCRRLVNAAAQFAAPRLTATLRGMAALPAEAPAGARDALRHCLGAALEWAPPEEACRAYALLSRVTRAPHRSKPDLITDQSHLTDYDELLASHAPAWRLQCEGALVRAAPRVVHTQAFKDLPTDLRKRLRELGCIVYGGPVAPPSSHKRTRNISSQLSRHESSELASTRVGDIDRVRTSFVPYAPKPRPRATALDGLVVSELRTGKTKSNPPKVRSTKAQEERAKYNMTKSVQPAVTTVVERVVSKARATYENAKPRYLEPKASRERDKSGAGSGYGVARAVVPRLVSSSESSRNSSPVAARARRSAAPHRSQDNLTAGSRPRTADPSTDSLTTDSHNTDKYATYTKAKRTTDGSVESIQSSRCYKQVAPTKIPVYLKQNTKTAATPVISKVMKKPKQLSEKVTENGSVPQVRVRATFERKVSGSLMNATKSSSAKMVNKIAREHNHRALNQDKGKANKQAAPLNEIPIMERSGTFLKDEPEFGDRTTNLHIDQ